jgi:hypothetical protein
MYHSSRQSNKELRIAAGALCEETAGHHCLLRTCLMLGESDAVLGVLTSFQEQGARGLTSIERAELAVIIARVFLRQGTVQRGRRGT